MFELHKTGTYRQAARGLPVSPFGHEHCGWWLTVVHSEFVPQMPILAQGSLHWWLMQDKCPGHPASDRQPALQVSPWHTSPVRQSSSRRQIGLQAPLSHRSLFKQPASLAHRGRHISEKQANPSGHCRFSAQGKAGERTQPTFAVGLGTIRLIQEQVARWLVTEQTAFGPHGFSSHGLLQRLLRQVSLALQSSSAWHPNTHLLRKHMCPRKQSLSTRQVTVKW